MNMTTILTFNANTTGFRTMRTYLRKNIEKLCMGNEDSVRKEYIMNSNGALSHASFILVAVPNNNRKTRSGKAGLNVDQLQGFLIGQIRQNDVYIDVICGTGKGLVLMKQARQIAIEKKKPFLRLSGLPGPMMAYYSYKLPESFIFADKNCKQVDSIETLAQSIKRYHKIGNIRASTREKTKLIRMLIKYQLTADKACTTATECGANGYSMLLCINQ